MTFKPISLQYEHFTVVIPAFNEAQYISHILDVLCQMSDHLAQIIVVDDASVDGTSEIVQSYGERDSRVHFLRLPANCGEGGAMLMGAEASFNDLVVFLDADLIGLRPEHILALIEPLWREESNMSLGIFTGGRRQTDWSHRLTPFLSGQRCLRWSLFRATPNLATARSGIEIALGLHARRHGYRVKTIPWAGVTHVMRSEKVGWLRGWGSHLWMYGEITGYLVGYLVKRSHRTTRSWWVAGRGDGEKQRTYRQLAAWWSKMR